MSVDLTLGIECVCMCAHTGMYTYEEDTDSVEA